MRHFFVLGSNPALSAAEILAVIGDRFSVVEVSTLVLTVESEEGAVFDAAAIMARLGGTIKIGTLDLVDIKVEAEPVEEYMIKTLRQNVGGATYGISIYGMDPEKTADRAAMAVGALKRTGMKVKTAVRATGSPARYVEAREGTALTSAAVGKNEMLTKGAEFVVLVKAGKMSVGRTLAIQPFEEFSMVDFGRPERDTIQGMLPPKLARMMLNIALGERAAVDTVIADPFCGSGTVLTEALLLGAREVYGSDKNAAAVEATKKNIAWLEEKKLAPQGVAGAKVATTDARRLKSHIPPASLDAIVTEPFLGPNRTGREPLGQLQKTLGELMVLYREALEECKPLLKPGACVVMVLPVYIAGAEKHGINAREFEKVGFRVESLVGKSVLSRLGVSEGRNKGILYGRPVQNVWREIVRLRPFELAAAPDSPIALEETEPGME